MFLSASTEGPFLLAEVMLRGLGMHVEGLCGTLEITPPQKNHRIFFFKWFFILKIFKNTQFNQSRSEGSPVRLKVMELWEIRVLIQDSDSKFYYCTAKQYQARHYKLPARRKARSTDAGKEVEVEQQLGATVSFRSKRREPEAGSEGNTQWLCCWRPRWGTWWWTCTQRRDLEVRRSLGRVNWVAIGESGSSSATCSEGSCVSKNCNAGRDWTASAFPCWERAAPVGFLFVPQQLKNTGQDRAQQVVLHTLRSASFPSASSPCFVAGNAGSHFSS